MRNVIAATIMMFTLVLATSALSATRTLSVQVSPIGMEYTPRQVHSFLRDRGFERVKFQDYDSGISVYEKRSSGGSEQRFRFTAYPQIRVVVRFEKKSNFFGKPTPRLLVMFIEDGRGSLSKIAVQEYERLLKDVIARVGADRVKVY